MRMPQSSLGVAGFEAAVIAGAADGRPGIGASLGASAGGAAGAAVGNAPGAVVGVVVGAVGGDVGGGIVFGNAAAQLADQFNAHVLGVG